MSKHLSLIGRILLSLVFIIHGGTKLFQFEQYWHGLELDGIVAAPLVSMMIIFIELGGGIAIMIGFYTRFFSPIMAVYFFIATLINYPFWNNFEFFDGFIIHMAIVGGLIIEDFAGAGPESVDDSHFFDT